MHKIVSCHIHERSGVPGVPPRITPRPRAIDGEGVLRGTRAGLIGGGGTLCHAGGGAWPVVVQT